MVRVGVGGSLQRATREVPDRPLPTKAGSVIVDATIQGEKGHTAILPDEGGLWYAMTRAEGARYHRADGITEWTPARIVADEEEA